MNDSYETPAPLYDYFNKRYRFQLDAAATEKNSKCSFFFIDAFSRNRWADYASRIWCNCPYSQQSRWIELCYEQAKLGGVTIVMLVMAFNGEHVWHHCVFGKATKLIFIGGRISFVNPDTKKSQRGNRFGSIAIVYEEGKIDTGHTEIESILKKEILNAPLSKQ